MYHVIWLAERKKVNLDFMDMVYINLGRMPDKFAINRSINNIFISNLMSNHTMNSEVNINEKKTH